MPKYTTSSLSTTKSKTDAQETDCSMWTTSRR